MSARALKRRKLSVEDGVKLGSRADSQPQDLLDNGSMEEDGTASEEDLVMAADGVSSEEDLEDADVDEESDGDGEDEDEQKETNEGSRMPQQSSAAQTSTEFTSKRAAPLNSRNTIKSASGANMFKLQSDEMLLRIKPDYSSQEAWAEPTLKKLKTIIEQAPACEPIPVSLSTRIAVRWNPDIRF